MKLTFAGSGSAFTTGYDNFQSNIILSNNDGKLLLIDCGTDARHSLFEQGLNHLNISDVYISHLHADHMGGLEWLGFSRRFSDNCERPNLFISDQLHDSLWENSLSGSMSSIEGEICTLETYFKVHAVQKNDCFEWSKIKFRLVQTPHVLSGFHLSPCHGLFFNINGENIYITADTQYVPSLLMRMYEDADIIFHDCETSPMPSGVHSHYDQLVELPPDIKKKMWLYHYNPGPLPDAESGGFKGFVKKGEEFDL